MVRGRYFWLIGAFLILLTACSGQATPTLTPTPLLAKEVLRQRAEEAYAAFNENRWDVVYEFLPPPVQEECALAQFAAWMELGMEGLLLSFERELAEEEPGYAGVFVEGAGPELEIEVVQVDTQGEEGWVTTKATLSRLAEVLHSGESPKLDHWVLVDGEWRWDWDLEEVGTICSSIVNIPSPTPTPAPTPEEPGYAWAYPAEPGTPLTVDRERKEGVFTIRITLLRIIRGDAAWQLIEKEYRLNTPPYSGFEYVLAKLRVEHLDGPGPEVSYRLFESDFWAASSDMRYYTQAWNTGAYEIPGPTLDGDVKHGEAREGWIALLVAQDDPAPVLTYKNYTTDVPLVWWKLYGDALLTDFGTGEGQPAGESSEFPPPVTHGTLLYDLDFSAPLHRTGEPPMGGFGEPPLRTVSTVTRGNPTVVDSFGLLLDQPLLFDSADGAGDQVELVFSGPRARMVTPGKPLSLPSGPRYAIEAELIIAETAAPDGFKILLDTPQVRTVTFLPHGEVRVFVPDETSTIIGSLPLNLRLRLRIDVDMEKDVWAVFVTDGVRTLAYSGAFGGTTELRSIRFSTPVTSPPPPVRAAIDNLRVTLLP